MKLISILSLMALAARAVPTPEEAVAAIDVDIEAAKSFPELFTGLEYPPSFESPPSIEARAPQSCYFNCIIRQGWVCNGVCGGSLKNKMSCITKCQQAGVSGCAKVCHK